MDKQGTQFYLNILLLYERHQKAMAEGWWPPSNWPNHSVPKTQTTAWRFMHTFLIYPLPDAWVNVVTSLNDVTIICSPSFSRKSTVHAQGNCHDFPAYPPASLPTIFYHYNKTCHLFHNPNFKPVTLYQVFCAPSHQSLQFIIRI